MQMQKLTIFKDPGNEGYIAHYSGDGDNEAHGIAINERLSDAIVYACIIWGLNEEAIYIEASN